jgi:hypothetical protein
MRVVAGCAVFFVAAGLWCPAQSALVSSGSSALDTNSGANTTCLTELLPGVDAKDGKGATTTVCKTETVSTCPLYMHVGQRAGGTLMSTDAEGRRVETFVARLKLELKDQRSDKSGQRMVSATVTVRGWNPKAGALPVSSGNGHYRNLVRTMTVSLTGGGLPDASAELKLPGFTAARMVELESITYEDGQVWTFSGGASCRVAPDLYMPVDASN